MPYYLDFTKLKLDFLEKRLSEEDLIPSQLPLREGLTEKLELLDSVGIRTLSDLNEAIQKDTSRNALSGGIGMSTEYLKLLARVLRAYTPKATKLATYPNTDVQVISKLAQQGIKDSYTLWTAASGSMNRTRLAADTDIPLEKLSTMVCLSDLSRIQWVSPLFARLIFDAGFKTVADVACAQAQELMTKISIINQKEKLFNGKIGERDMGRLVYLASLLPHELEMS